MQFDLLETQAVTCPQSMDSDSIDSECLTGALSVAGCATGMVLYIRLIELSELRR